jgi:alkanesulfonate monooxygenase SsuD/methylene tetrahydromethanopterin reductase-like flavin-dependent oxidoreductase (luciferase family)
MPFSEASKTQADVSAARRDVMDLGLFMMPLHSGERDYRELLEQDRDAIKLADRLGYAEAWVGEHYTASPEPITNPLQFMATLIHETKHIKFATGVINLPQHHPAMVAGDVAQFDHLSSGRYVMGVGPGGLISDFELFKTTDMNRSEMMVESVRMIHEIWRSDPPYNVTGKYWDAVVQKTHHPNVGFGPMRKPFQKPYPPLAVSAMSPNSSTARTAGSQGWGIVSANFMPVNQMKTHWNQYIIGAESAGLRPDRQNWRIARSILVGDSEAEVAEYFARPDNSYNFYYDYLVQDMRLFNMLGIFKPEASIPDAQVDAKSCIDWIVMRGTVDSVVDQLVAMIDQTGSFRELLLTHKDWVDDPSVHKKSMELMAEKVLPRIRQHLSSLKTAAD